MKHKLYILFISLVMLCSPELLSAQARGVAPARSGSTRTTTQARPASTAPKPVAVMPSTSDNTEYYTLKDNSNFAHWSYGIMGGTNIFDGDIRESATRLVPTARMDLTLGANIDYTFNPMFGLGVEYLYIPYAASTASYKMSGTAHETDVYLSFNFLNLMYRGTRPQKWQIYANIGMGFAFYSAKQTVRATGEIRKDAEGRLLQLTDGKGLVWPISALLEYNISKYFAVGFKAEYRLHDKDNLEGYPYNIRQGNWNDAFEIFTLTLRHKLHFGKNVHVRDAMYGDPMTSSRNMEQRIAALEKQLADAMAAKSDTCCQSNAQKIADLEKKLREMPAVTTPPPVKQDTVVVGKPVISESAKKAFNEALRGVQFETAKADIKPVSYPILDKVVAVMQENPQFDLDIIGHTDSQGDAKMNMDLSDRRAHAVRQYLMNKGVSGTRLTSWGRGLEEPVATNNTVEGRALNRRVEFVVKFYNEVVFRTEQPQLTK